MLENSILDERSHTAPSLAHSRFYITMFFTHFRLFTIAV
uniref:Uncharacterized protein n=1 Tax=Rhizophora mucronata TaxID=61149 RepID=A0A2P2NEL8_RHIMU